MISVVIPLYNKVDTIRRALNSVKNQTFRDFEIIVVDDGSTDGGGSVVESFEQQNLRIVRQKNAGVSAARNHGIEEAKGEYVAFLDADDEWKHDYLQTQMLLAEKYPTCDVFVTNYEHISEGGVISPTIIRKLSFPGEDGILSNYFEVASCSHPPICSSSIIVRKKAMDVIGGFPVGVISGEDLLTWARLAASFKIAYCKKSLALYHVEGYDLKERTKRVPSKTDVVGRELQLIAEQYHPDNINRYISHWHKMRCAIFMRLGMRKESIHEAIYGLKYNIKNYKLFAYILMNLIPRK